jgi:glycosyltransferase involved in cell wall biosynthesis
MKIGFDAKRAFFNRSGLGNYSRDTIAIMSGYFPMNEHVLYTPKPKKSKLFVTRDNISISGPRKFWHKQFPSYWRTFGISNQLKKDKINLYHGLSNELPNDIDKTGIPSIVTIHDLIFMRYPQLYKSFDRRIYEKKFRYAAQTATKVIAVSQQTKEDIIDFFKIPENKIEVVYQGCNPIFWDTFSDYQKEEILMKYAVPERFILSVGRIEERKNLLNIVKALYKAKVDLPLVVIGKPTKYLEKIKSFVKTNEIRNIFFLHNVPSEDLPAFYQQSEMFVYPSLFEGFGIPILEALTSKTPVITSRGGCFAEAGGKSSIYVDPENIDEIASAIRIIATSSTIRDNMIIDGYIHAQQFRQEKIASNMIEVYEKVV